jgi:nucleoside-diphosphate-sugar epimerase
VFIYASSGGVYGFAPETLIESRPLNPPNFYLCSKQAAEIMVAQYQAFFHTVILRPFSPYGPGQRGMMIPNLLQKVRQQELINIEGDPGLRSNPLYVEDAVRAFVAALALNHSDIINLAGDETVSITELVNLMGAVTGQAPRLQYQPRAAEGDLVADNTRMKEVLGVTPQTRLRAGLRAML